MNARSLLTLALMSASSLAVADGPFTHVSDGVTQPYIVWSGGAIVDAQCTPGSRCVVKNALSPLSPTAGQSSTFMIQTSTTVGTDHFAFGVRGIPYNISCPSPSILRSNPFTGRGIALYASLGKVKFENFTGNCVGGGGVAETTTQSISFRPNQKYLVSVWANDTNTWFSIDRYYYNTVDRIWDYQYVGGGDCRALAQSHEDHICGRHPQDPTSANRAFIAHTQDLRWNISQWYID